MFARGDGVKRVFVTDPDGHVIELMQTGIEVTGAEPRLKAPQRGYRPWMHATCLVCTPEAIA